MKTKVCVASIEDEPVSHILDCSQEFYLRQLVLLTRVLGFTECEAERILDGMFRCVKSGIKLPSSWPSNPIVSGATVAVTPESVVQPIRVGDDGADEPTIVDYQITKGANMNEELRAKIEAVRKSLKQKKEPPAEPVIHAGEPGTGNCIGTAGFMKPAEPPNDPVAARPYRLYVRMSNGNILVNPWLYCRVAVEVDSEAVLQFTEAVKRYINTVYDGVRLRGCSWTMEQCDDRYYMAANLEFIPANTGYPQEVGDFTDIFRFVTVVTGVNNF